MQSRPIGWPIEGAIETIPETFVRLPGSSWPPARGKVPAGTGECSSWSITRSLTGGLLPGQVRGVSGFSVAVADVSIPQSAGSLMSPWAGPGYQLSVGGAAEIYATHDGPDGSSELPLGKFRVEPITGASTDPVIGVSLIEDSGRLKRPMAIKWDYTTPSEYADNFTMDACWVLDQVARFGGYYSTAKPTAATLFSMPLVGGPACDRGRTTRSVVGQWREVDSRVGLSGVSSIDATHSDFSDVTYLSVEVSDAGGVIRLGDLLFNVSSTGIAVRQGSSLKAEVGWPDQGSRTVQVLMARSSATRFFLQVRLGPFDSWSAQQEVSHTGLSPWADDSLTVSTLGGNGFIRAVRFEGSESRVPWDTPTAIISLAGSPIHGIFDTEKKPAWDLAQSIAKATFGGLWISEDGIFTFRSRQSLRGLGEPVETVNALTQLESLPWRIDPADIADRIEVTYTPSEVTRAPDSITLWEATNSLRIYGNSTRVIYADIEGTTDRISAFQPLWAGTQQARFSRWAASYTSSGGGTRPPDDALSISTQMAGLSRVKITIRNNTASSLWMIDGSGDPCLTIRTSVQVIPGEPVTVERGLPEDQALAPLSVDCGPAVQDHQVAVELCGWLEGQTRVALPVVEQVRVKPKLRRQLGDIILLTDGITSLHIKAIITGIRLTGERTGYSQVLNLALLAPTFNDFDQWLKDQKIVTFTQLDQWFLQQGISTFAQFDQRLETLGRTL